MKMSAIEEIGPIEVQEAGRQASGEIAEINNNYKTAHGTIQSNTIQIQIQLQKGHNTVKYDTIEVKLLEAA